LNSEEEMLAPSQIAPRPSRKVLCGTVLIGGDQPIAVQSMCATKTTDIEKTLEQIRLLESRQTDLIRIAIDSKKDVEALKEIRKETTSNLVVDLQENYRLAADVAPIVQKIRYNPGHLHHHQKNVAVLDKVKFLVETAGAHDCAMRIGVNFGSIDPEKKGEGEDPMQAALNSALEHAEMVEALGFRRFLVSLKSSDPRKVVDINKAFHKERPEVPLHLGVTEAGLMPEAIYKTRIAFEKLLAVGIGDTVRISLTVTDDKKYLEAEYAREIMLDIVNDRFRSVPDFLDGGLNVISCPSCSRVENGAFVGLAEKVKEVTQFAKQHAVTIAVMGCRVNGPGETDEADIGLWCGPKLVNLKRGTELVGAYSYDDVVGQLISEVKTLIAKKHSNQTA
jgi:(E)-4-hydroxy-3-methylbut-2-enyl-diphosphate synthase